MILALIACVVLEYCVNKVAVLFKQRGRKSITTRSPNSRRKRDFQRRKKLINTENERNFRGIQKKYKRLWRGWPEIHKIRRNVTPINTTLEARKVNEGEAYKHTNS